jgi:hypothetical protein
MEAKDNHKEMLPIWAAFLCGYPLLHPYFLPTKNLLVFTPNDRNVYIPVIGSCKSLVV